MNDGRNHTNGAAVTARADKLVCEAIKTLTDHFARQWSKNGQWCGFCSARIHKQSSLKTTHKHPCPFHAIHLALRPSGNGSPYGQPPT
ncbi:hypothetical protein [uncultured Mediterranean phage uvDeep-CGR2-KM19-C37]|nr:hypothetical protein [uncultured Mediterranean phage uvDeep-CGR2-KM19-C37]